MKRFHVHLHVEDLARSIGFYSKLFAAAPTRVEADYAKWMLDDPRVNFAISTRGPAGLDHLGLQADDAAELAALKARAEAADLALLDEGETTCCYARSDKHWITDPQGIAWEHFHTLGDIAVFSEGRKPAGAAACCAPADAAGPAAADAAQAGGCCAPAATATAAATNTANAETDAGSCCPPRPRGKPIGIPVKSSSSCC